MKKIFFSLIILFSLNTLAQEKKKEISVKTYGFVGFDTYVDTRASLTARGSGYLYPLGFSPDANKKDINDRKSFDFAANISRLGFKVSGPDVLGAKASAKIECDFAGTSGNSKDFAIRLRHAFLNLNWNKISLLAGQTWHPMFIPENFPTTVNFVVGVPFSPLSRAPQLRFNYKAGQDLLLSLVALSQGDFINSGILNQVEMAGMPEFDFQLKYGSKKDLFFAATFGTKQVLPTLLDDNKLISNNTVTSIHGNICLKYKTPALTFKADAIYGGNMTNLVMIGGLARKTKNGSTVNGEYAAIRTSSYWTEVHSNGKTFQYGLFAGVTNNLGTSDESTIIEKETIYNRGGDIEKMYIISPRITYTSGPVKIGLELNHTIAYYGTNIDENSKPINTTDYANNRLILGFRYNF